MRVPLTPAREGGVEGLEALADWVKRVSPDGEVLARQLRGCGLRLAWRAAY